MIFECRQNPPECSPSFTPAREAFLRGDIQAARAMADQLRSDRILPTCTADLLLCVDISRAGARLHEYFATGLIGFKRFPEERDMQFLHAQVLSSMGRFPKTIRQLEAIEPAINDPDFCMWHARMGVTYAMMNCPRSAARHLDAARARVRDEDALIWYELAYSAISLTRWEEALDLLDRCVEAAPGWQRAHMHRVNANLSLGRLQEARRILEKQLATGLRDAHLEFNACMLESAEGDFEKSIPALRQYREDWPRSIYHGYITCSLALALVEQDQFEEAKALIAEDEIVEKLLEDTTNTGAHRILAMPLVAQRRNQCVPTTVMMSAWPQGISLDAEALFEAMEGREGTALWRMRAYMREQNFRVECVRAEPEIIRACIDSNVPLIGVLEGPMNSHVEVICGYDDRLSRIHVRDPMNWFPSSVPYETIEERYQLNDASVWAVIAPTQAALKLPEDWLSDVGAALVDLHAACANGNREKAEAAAARIPEDAPAAFLRDQVGVRMTISPSELTRRYESTAADRESNFVARFRALFSMFSLDKVDELKALIREEREDHGPFVERLMMLTAAMTESKWEEAKQRVEFLLERHAAMDTLWSFHSDILAELNDLKAARRSLSIALEMAPYNSWYREKALRLRMMDLPYQERIDEIRRLIQEDADALSLKMVELNLLTESPDGLEYEAAAKEALRFFPRDPELVLRLADWYDHQGRDDLSGPLLRQHREWIGEDDLPLQSTERMEEKEEAEDQGNTPEDVAQQVDRLPDDKGILFHRARYECVAGSEGEMAAFNALEKMEAQATSWFWNDAAALCGLRFFRESMRPENASRNERLRELLPDPPAGPADTSILVTLNLIPTQATDPSAARLLLEWFDRHVPDPKAAPDLWFQRAVLLESTGALQEALMQYENLRATHSGYVGAHYRVGEVRYQQSEYPEAIAAYQAALDIAPGLDGALEQLVTLHEIVGDRTAARECQEKTVARYPYGIAQFTDLITAIAEEHGDVEPALARIEQDGVRHRPGSLAALKARMLSEAGRPDEALELLNEHPEAEALHAYNVHSTRLNIALNQDDKPAMRRLAEAGRKEFPDDPWFITILALCDRDENPQTARTLLEEAFRAGDCDPQMADLYFSMSTQPGADAIRLVESQESPQEQAALARVFDPVLQAPQHFDDQLKFLRWCNKHLPDEREFRDRLATQLHIGGKTEESIQVAEALHREFPNDPRMLWLMGVVYADKDAKKSLKFLREEFEMTQSVDTLSRIARSLLIQGEQKECIQAYKQVLSRNPTDALAVSSLFLLGEPPRTLWKQTAFILERGFGTQCDYFHVAAVDIAMQVGEPVPELWLPAALDRLQILDTRPPFGDEKARLKQAISLWSQTVNDPTLKELKGNIWVRLKSRFNWPKKKTWIPG